MTLNRKTVPASQRDDKIKWLAVILLMISITVANFYFSSQPSAIKAAGNLVGGLIVIGIVSFTKKAEQWKLSARETRMELRKVVWPTRQETIRTTLVIAVVVGLAALFLWGVDSVLLWATSFLTSQRG